MGGAVDMEDKTSPYHWAPAIAKLNKNIEYQALYKIAKSGPAYWDSDATTGFPMVDNLAIDGTTALGTTQGSILSNPGDHVYVFTVTNISGGTMTSTMVKLSLSGSMKVTGMYPALVPGPFLSAVHLTYYDPGNNLLSYVAVTPSTATVTAVKLYTSISYIRETLFISGGSTDTSVTGHTIY